MSKILFVLVGMILILGCSSDDTVAPPSDLDQSVAISQAQVISGMSVEMVEAVMDFADMAPGDRKDEITYQYIDGAWVWEFTMTDDMGTVSLNMWLQYLNDSGDPTPDPDNAVSLQYTIDAEADLAYDDGDNHYAVTWDYQTDTSVSGLNTDILLAHWHGNQNYSTSLTSPSGNQTVQLDISWATGDSGLTVPQNGDCPEGSIEISIAPYEMEMVFDGTNIASWTLDWMGEMVANGTETLDCGQ